MERSTLFLLPPGFEDNGRREFCPECAELWGFLHYYPAIKDALEIRYEEIAHPRTGLVAMLGDGRWNCPTLVLSADAPRQDHPDIKESGERRYLDSARAIERYFSAVFGTAHPRGG